MKSININKFKKNYMEKQIEKQEMFLISKEQRDNLLAYLMSRPFQEVEAGVMWLRSLQPVKEKEAVNDTK